MKKLLKILLTIIAILILINGFTYAEKIQNFLHTKEIEGQNQETMKEIDKSEIITKSPKEVTKASTINIDFDEEMTLKDSQTYFIEKLEETKKINPIEKKELIKRESQTTIPNQAYLEVDFICQAPLQTEANWKYHEESCEEAAVLQAYLYETNQSKSKEEANEIILDMIDWQIENFGGHYDIYADQVKEFIVKYYDIPEKNVVVKYNSSIEDIKRIISKGHPIIVPITGEILQNPYYPYPGYHMLTVIGYTENRIITNDNGTRRGADFSYDISTFKKAMDDAGGDIVYIKF